MKTYLSLTLALLISSLTFGQQTDYNLQDGYVAEGYDVVAYFAKAPQKGKSAYTYTYDGAKYKFANQANLNAFKANPKKYVPQYGGWCAYAVGAKNEKVSVDPKTYEIRDGKLYLFYNAYFTNTLKSWQSEGPEQLRAKADKNWQTLKYKK